MRIGTSEKCDFSRITELCVIQSQSSLSRTRVGRFFDNAMTLPCNDTHAVSVIVGPTRAHWAQNERTRAARAARGAALRGRPSHVARRCRALQGASRARARGHAYHRATLAPRQAAECDQDGARCSPPSACVWRNSVGQVCAPLGARETTPRRPCRACSRRLAMSNTRNSRACNLGGPCVARQLRPRDWAGPAGPPPWLHAQRACAHFAISRPL